AAIRTRAVRDGDHYVLNGSKMFITNGALADLYFVAARVEAGDETRRHRGISMFLVERETPGFAVSRTLDKMGMRASDTAELSFQDVRVPAGNLLGREGVGFYEVMRVFQRERLVAGVHAVAMAERALEDTIAYVRERQAFGGPLSEKQVVRHKPGRRRAVRRRHRVPARAFGRAPHEPRRRLPARPDPVADRGRQRPGRGHDALRAPAGSPGARVARPRRSRSAREGRRAGRLARSRADAAGPGPRRGRADDRDPVHRRRGRRRGAGMATDHGARRARRRSAL